MKILQVWEWAGIASIYSKYFRTLGHEVEVLKTQDFFGYLPFYNNKLLKGSISTAAKVGLEIGHKYDVIHIHAMPKIVRAYRQQFPNKKIIIHYHGTEARISKQDYNEYNKFADHVFVSTKDLLDYNPDAEWLPNIVDTDHFHNREIGKGMLAIISGRMKIDKATLIVKQLNLDVEIIQRIANNFIGYKYMPEKLANYEVYVDLKTVDSLSTTALQALSVGLSVIKTNGVCIREFPKEHNPINVINRLIEVYNE